ncbi:MAG: hypothetical protein ACHQ51_14650 [Elusimicrobiota bacterium]
MIRIMMAAFVALLCLARPLLAADGTLPAKTLKINPTQDITVIGWINGTAIDLPTQLDGVSNSIIQDLDSNPVICALTLGEWSQGVATDLDTAANRSYANAFLIKFSGNGEPPNPLDSSSYALGGDYRLFNEVKVAYRAKDGTIIAQPAPHFLKQIAINGKTPDPCGVVSPVDSQANAANGARGIGSSGADVYQVTEARLGTLGQQVNTTINGATTPWIWSVIEFDIKGNLVFPFALQSKPNTSMFPTFYVYADGQRIKTVLPGGLVTFIGLDATYQITGDVP